MSARLVTDYAKFSFDEKFNPLNKEADVKRIYIEPSLSFEKGNVSSLTSFKAGRRETEYQTKLDPIDNSYNWAELSYRIYMEKKSKNQFHSLTPIFKYVYIDGENNYEKRIDSKLQNLGNQNGSSFWYHNFWLQLEISLSLTFGTMFRS